MEDQYVSLTDAETIGAKYIRRAVREGYRKGVDDAARDMITHGRLMLVIGFVLGIIFGMWLVAVVFE